MLWRTGCVGCERICGGKRRHSEPEASPEANRQERSDCTPSTAALTGRTASEVTARTAGPVPTRLKGGADVGLGEAKDTGCGERSARNGTRQCPVPVLPRSAKTSFPGRGAALLRFAAPSA